MVAMGLDDSWTGTAFGGRWKATDEGEGRKRGWLFRVWKEKLHRLEVLAGRHKGISLTYRRGGADLEGIEVGEGAESMKLEFEALKETGIQLLKISEDVELRKRKDLSLGSNGMGLTVALCLNVGGWFPVTKTP